MKAGPGLKILRMLPLIVSAILAGTTRSAAQLPSDPVSPLSPKSYNECSTLQRQWDDVYRRTDQMHEDCLESHRKAGEKGNFEASNAQTCTFPGCQSLHTRKREISRRTDQAVEQCRNDVGNYLESERRRREADARAEEERRRIADENNRRIAEANRRAADAAAEQRRAADAERQRRINETNRQVAGIEARRQAASNAINTLYNQLMTISENSRQRAAERREERQREEEYAEMQRQNEEREQAERERQEAERQRLAYEEEARRAADESARRAREGSYTRDIIESDIAEREAEANRGKNSTEDDLGSRILEEMKSYESSADSIFGTDAGLSIADLDLATNAYVSEPGRSGDSGIVPGADSPMHDLFDKIGNIEPSGTVAHNARWLKEKKDQLWELKEQLKEKFPEWAIETAQDKTIEKLSEDWWFEEEEEERDWSKWSGVGDFVWEKAIDAAKSHLIERVQDFYAKVRATRQGESEPDPVLLQYYKTEAAAHPLTGLWLQLLSEKGNFPVAFHEYYKNLIERFGGLLGMATDEPIP